MPPLPPLLLTDVPVNCPTMGCLDLPCGHVMYAGESVDGLTKIAPQHAVAVSENVDANRPISDAGRAETQKMAGLLASSSLVGWSNL